MRGRKESCSLRTGPWVQLAHHSSAGRQAGECIVNNKHPPTRALAICSWAV